MKVTQLIILIVLFTANGLVAQGTLTLNAGDIFVHEFTSLPLSGLGSPGEPYPTFGMLGVSFSSNSQAGSTLHWELFEGSSLEPSVGSGNIDVPVFPLPPNNAFWVNGIWQDLQGVVRLTALSGTIVLNQVGVSVQRHDAGGYFTYSAGLPIPEPSPVGYFGVGITLLAFLRIKNLRDRTAQMNLSGMAAPMQLCPTA